MYTNEEIQTTDSQQTPSANPIKTYWLKWHDAIYHLSQRSVSIPEALLLVALLWGALFFEYSQLQKHLQELEKNLSNTNHILEETATAVETAEVINSMKTKDIQKIKSVLVSQTKTQKKFYEENLILADEKRQLEKQWDILITYLMLDAETGKLKLMKGDQAAKNYKVEPVQCWGNYILENNKPITVTSKERFAHPERGRVEIQEGQLNWIPPQVGPASRNLALGEHVLFTNTSLILHAPAKDKQQHEAYPHCCIPMRSGTAKQVYDAVYVGSRILVPNDSQ
ncbi:MAG: L,D-transpeptidase [Elusimicrobia bacterium]|nr:L,D-transpeptidase [Elusimicrobiota bacterium]